MPYYAIRLARRGSALLDLVPHFDNDDNDGLRASPAHASVEPARRSDG